MKSCDVWKLRVRLKGILDFTSCPEGSFWLRISEGLIRLNKADYEPADLKGFKQDDVVYIKDKKITLATDEEIKEFLVLLQFDRHLLGYKIETLEKKLWELKNG